MSRRQAHSRDDRRQRLRGWLRRLALASASGAVLAAGLAAYQYLCDPQTFPVRTLRLSGELTRTDVRRLQAIAMPYAARGFLRLDVDGLRTAVAGEPWVREAAVRRVWPDRLEITIREQRPLARWSEQALVSEEGRLFAPPKAEWPAGLPAFSGPEGSAPAVAQRYREVREILDPLSLTVAGLSLSERRAWRLELADGLVVLLGRDDSQARLERFARVYSKTVAERTADIAQVDLRYTNGFAVAWKKRPAA